MTNISHAVLTIAFSTLLFQASHAAEVATGAGTTNYAYTAVTPAAPSMATLHRCVTSAKNGGEMMALSANLCAHDWISPSTLPQKFERAYRSEPDRVEVYDLRGRKGVVDAQNRQLHEMNPGGDECFTLAVPAPIPEANVRVGSPIFDCSASDCAAGRAPPPLTPPARTITEYKDTGEVRDAVRDALYPRATNQFVIAWLRARDETGPWGRKAMEDKLKRAICDCERAGVIDSKTLSALAERLRSATGAKSETDRQGLKKVAEELEACANPAVS